MQPSSHFFLRFTIAEEQTLAAFLTANLASHHQVQIDDWLSQGLILVDGSTPLDAAQRLEVGQCVDIHIPNHIEEPVNTDWQTLWENEELLAVYKPPLLPVSRTTRNLYWTLISLVRRESTHFDAQLLHRLDTETSGIILLAKNKAVDKKWKQRLAELMVQKIYHAWVEGVPEWKQTSVEGLLAEKVNSPIRSQMYVVDSEEADLYLKPKPSKTRFDVVQRQADQALVKCTLETGRKHQIRAHLTYLGFPIIGDKIYAHEGAYYLKRLEKTLDENDFEQLGSPHHRLVATELVLNLDGQTLTISLPPALLNKALTL